MNALEMAAYKKIIKHKYAFNEFGLFQKPNDFTPTIPIDFWRDNNGVIQQNFENSDLYDEFYNSPTEIYVNKTTGNDTTGNGSSGNPYKTLYKAGNVIASTGAGTYQVKVTSDSVFTRDEGFGAYGLTLATDTIVSIIPNNTSNKIIQTTAQSGLVWTSIDNIWRASRSNAAVVIDLRTTYDSGVYGHYVPASSVDACKSTSNSWYTDNTYVYVNNGSEIAPTLNDTWVLVIVGNMDVTLEGTAKLYIKNIENYFCKTSTNSTEIVGTVSGGEAVGTFIAENCIFAYVDTRHNSSGSNTLSIQDVKTTILLNCVGAYGRDDIFNYHYYNTDVDKTKNCLVIEYGCNIHNGGYLNTSDTSNCTTAHEGINIIRINGTCNDSKRPIQDTNGCYSVLIDVITKGATSTYGNFYFTNTSGTKGKAFIINCSDEFDNVIGLNCEVESFIVDFVGNIKDTGQQNIII